VAVWVRDVFGWTSDPATAAIDLDTIAPEDGSLSATWSGEAATLSWTEASDARSGVASYVVVHAAGDRAPADCESGTVVFEGAATAVSLESLSNTDTHAFRLCAVDAARNSSEGVTGSLDPSGSLSGSVIINDGEFYTSERAVSLGLEADGATEMCLSNTPRCGDDSWRAFEPELTWYVPNQEGDHTVSVWFRNASGTESDAATAEVHADWTRPSTGDVQATLSLQGNRARVSWSGFADAESGLASIRVVPVRGRLGAPTCLVGGVTIDPEETSLTMDFQIRGPDPRVGVCAVDRAGNETRVVVASVEY
jgi:hypothetical protein